MIKPEYLDFTSKHLKEDIHTILLSANKFKEIDVKYAAVLIAAKQKLMNKMPDWANNKELYFPSEVSAEQCSSFYTGYNKQNIIKDGIVLDITGGIGVDSFFFAAVNSKVYYYEQNRELYNATKYNFNKLGVDNIIFENRKTDSSFISKIIEEITEANRGKQVLLYIDPSRRSEKGEKVRSPYKYEPDIFEILEALQDTQVKIAIKLSPLTDIKAISRVISDIEKVQIVSVSNDCKELLIIMNTSQNKVKPEEFIIEAVMYAKNGSLRKFSFTHSQEKECTIKYAQDIHKQSFLYEPDNALLSVGAFKSVSLAYDVCKIAPNTHLYLSSDIVANFPGKIFKIIKVADYNKYSIRNLNKNYPKANVAVRNFHINAVSLKKEIKVNDGGNITIFGCTVYSGQRKIIVTERIS